MKITNEVETLADLRQFVTSCEAMGVPETAQVHARVRFTPSTDGQRLKELTARTVDDAGLPGGRR